MHAEDGEGEAVDPDAEARRNRGRDELADELLPPAQPAEVVDRADGCRDGGAEQQPAHIAVEVEERERRDEDAEEQREPAETRHRARVRAPSLPRSVDDSQQPSHSADGRRQQYDDQHGDAEAVEDLEVVPELVPDHFVP